MLEYLQIHNFLHVEHAEIHFGEGLHCITGESGAGKTVLIKALKFLMGEKPPLQENAQQTVVEALFTLPKNSPVPRLLVESGIEESEDQTLILKRIVSSESRSKYFINSQMAAAPLAQKVMENLIEIVDQHAGKLLFSPEYQRELLDIYGGYTETLKEYGEAFTDLKETQRQLATLRKENPHTEDQLRHQKEELEKHDIPSINVEEIVQLHEKCAHSQEIAETLSSQVVALKERISLELHSIIRNLDKIAAFDATLSPLSAELESVLIAVDDVALSGERYLESLEFDEEAYAKADQIISFLSYFKRKYNVPIEEIPAEYERICSDLASIDSLQLKIQELEKKRNLLETLRAKSGTKLTTCRLASSQTLSLAVTESLAALKMEETVFSIQVTPCDYKASGADDVAFFIAHAGLKQVPLKTAASGGEISRILLAIRSHIAEKQATPTLIFDEVDANIGGETANVVADLLFKTARSQQLLTITHFPQVASKADHHIVVEKNLKNGLPLATIRTLSLSERKGELLRMIGGKESALLFTPE